MPTPFFADLVRELCQEGGTGPLTPTGAVSGHRRFAGAVPADTDFHYAIAGIAHPGQWETGRGRIDGSGRLVRSAVAASSDGGATVDFTPGLKTLALTVGAAWFAGTDAAVAARQPLSTSHSAAATGAAGDAVTVRRGDGWVNIPLATLAFRDAAGLHVLAGQLGAQNGSAAAPAISFAERRDTGLFSSAAGSIGVACGGTERVRFDASGVGIGGIAPLVDLHVLTGSEALRLETLAPRGSGAVFQSWHDASGRKGYLGYAGSNALVIQNELSGDLILGCNNTSYLNITTSGALRPTYENVQPMGTAACRLSVVYAGSGAINTSDAREKVWRGEPTPSELAAAKLIAGELGFFQWVDAIAEKGIDGARRHFGVRAQAVWAIMAGAGLIDPIVAGTAPDCRYAFLCHDAWDDERDDEGAITRVAGDRFGIRPDELALFLIAAQEARLAVLEAAS